MNVTINKVLIALAALLVFGVIYYLLSPLFITVAVDESLPKVSDSGEVIELRAPAVIQETPTHPAEGTVSLIEVSGTQFIRYENFKTLNGPDLYVYLAKDFEANEYVEVSRLRATEGNINYEVPDGIDATEYPYVLVWCKIFGVLFNYAELRG